MEEQQGSAPAGEATNGQPSAIAQVLQEVRDGTLTIEEGAKRVQEAAARTSLALLAMAGGPRFDTRPGPPPQWAMVPPELKLPEKRQVLFMRFPSEWTDAPHVGYQLEGEGERKWRTCIAWPLTDTEETMAYQRGRGDQQRGGNELVKQMLRAVDGHVASWANRGELGSIDVFWTQIGSKCRGLLSRAYNQLHVLSPAEQVLFFESCVEARLG